MASTQDSTIFEAASRCWNHFSELLDLHNNDTVKLQLFEELRGRFSIWGSYIGVFAPPLSSLDARLDPHPDLKNMVLELLDMVTRNILWGDCRLRCLIVGFDLTCDYNDSREGIDADNRESLIK